MQVQEHLRKSDFLVPFQSGFRPQHSCESALLLVTSDIRDALDLDQLTVLTLLDFSKAFDSVDHLRLLWKLSDSFKFSTSATRLIRSFLSDRYQRVDINGTLSSLLPVPRGVPQGSLLGPLLFSLYINDLPSALRNSKIHMYADDVQIYISRPIGLMEDAITRMNEDLMRIHMWSHENNLQLNPKKCCSMVVYRKVMDTSLLPSIYLNGINLPYVNHVRNLGVIINSRMTCCDHVSTILSKVYGGLRRLWLNAYLLSTKLRAKLVKSLILPHLLYGSLIFPKLDSVCSRRIVVAFNDMIRFVHDLPRSAHVSEHARNLLGCDFQEYLNMKSLRFLHKLILDRIPSYLYERLIFLESCRSKQLLLPRFTSKFGEMSYFVQAIRSWNRLPSAIQRASSPGTFSKLLWRRAVT